MDATAVEPLPSSPRTRTSGADRLHVVLTTEGTYPHYKGGVSTWCQTLIEQMPEVDFTLWALMMNPHIAEQYVLPPNVVEFIGLPMWGVEEPLEYTPSVPAARVVSLSRATTEKRVAGGFVPLLEELLRQIGSPSFDPLRFADLLHQMHGWFAENGYRESFRSRSTWLAAKAVLLENSNLPYDEPLPDELVHSPERGPTLAEGRKRLHELRSLPPATEQSRSIGENLLPTLNDATEGLRWLYRLLMPLNFPIVRADIVHSSAAAFCGIPAILSKLEHGTPFLLTEHGVYMREQYLAIARFGYPYHLKKFIIQMVAAISRTCFTLADQVSPVCQYNARWELRNGVEPSRLRVIYNGVDPQVFTPRPVARPSVPTVVTLARIDPLKDLETFLRVADQVRRRVPDVQFLHWGPAIDREYEQKVRNLWEQLHLQDTVRFMGATDDPAGAINQGDVVVLTSISEAFPYAVVEALMCGKPVVATDVGGVGEALDGTGMLTRPGDAEGFADAVVRILALDASSRASLAEACRKRALDLFTVGASIDAYRRSYLDLARVARPVRAVGVEELVGVTTSDGGRFDYVPAAWDSGLVAAATVRDVAENEDVMRPRIRAIPGEPGPVTSSGPPQMLDRLVHPDPAVRRLAALEVAERGGLEAIGELGDLLAGDPDAEVRAAALAALASVLERKAS
ncbi:MAG: GT4 family glycosyltransferase PelF [Acidimicrobiales bacterium]